MGLFKCPGCSADIDWFLVAPCDYVCKTCGRTVTQGGNTNGTK